MSKVIISKRKRDKIESMVWAVTEGNLYQIHKDIRCAVTPLIARLLSIY